MALVLAGPHLPEPLPKELLRQRQAVLKVTGWSAPCTFAGAYAGQIAHEILQEQRAEAREVEAGRPVFAQMGHGSVFSREPKRKTKETDTQEPVRRLMCDFPDFRGPSAVRTCFESVAKRVEPLESVQGCNGVGGNGHNIFRVPVLCRLVLCCECGSVSLVCVCVRAVRGGPSWLPAGPQIFSSFHPVPTPHESNYVY